MLLRGLDAEILVHPRQLLDAAVEQHEVVHQLDQPVLAAHLEQVLVQLEAAVVRFVLLPLQEILLRRADGAVLQALGIVAGEDELHGAEEPLVELGLLVGKVLPDAVADGDAAVLQLQHADGDAVDIEHEVRPPLVVALERHLLGDGKVVLLRLIPVDEVDGFRDLARLDLHRHAVAQQVVDGLVVAVEAAAVVVRLGAQLVDGHVDLRRGVAAFGQVSREQPFLDVAVAVAVGPVAEVAVAQFVAEQGDDAVLGGTFGFAHTHYSSSWPRTSFST